MQAAAFRTGLGRQCFHSSHSCSRPRAAATAPLKPATRLVLVHSMYPRDSEESNASSSAAQALRELFALEAAGYDALTLENLRLKYGIRRGLDGRAQLRRRDGTWFQIKLDMEMSGTMLLRDTSDGAVHVLQTEKLEQIDLSDDYLLLTLFADGEWENEITPIQFTGETDEMEPMRVSEQQFKDFVGIIKTLQDLEEQELKQRGNGPIDVTAEPANGR